MSPQLLLSLTHEKLHAHKQDLTPCPVPVAAPTVIAASATFLAEGSKSGSVILRDPFTLHPVHTLPSHTSSVTALAISATYLAVGHTDGVIFFHNLNTHDHASFAESSQIISLAFSSTLRHLAAATSSDVALYSTVSNRLITRLTQPATRSYPRIAVAQARFTAVAFSPIHQTLLAATDDTGCLTVYDISTVLSSGRTHPVKATLASSTSQTRFPSAFKAPSTDLSFSPDGHLAVVGFDKLVRIFHPSLKQLLFTVALPSPISAVHFGSSVSVGLTDASIAIVNLDIEAASGTIVRRVSIEAGEGTGGSRAVKAILLQPKPKRRKPPRSSTPLEIPSGDVNEDMLADVDHVLKGSLASVRSAKDDELFSPLKENTTHPRYGKSASFHASPAERASATPRSRSIHSITTHGQPLEDKLGIEQNVAEEPRAADDFFDEDVDRVDLAPRRVLEDFFEVATKRDTMESANDARRRENNSSYSHDPDPAKSLTIHTRTSSSTKTDLASTESHIEGKRLESVSSMRTPSSNKNLSGKNSSDKGKDRSVRFEYMQDVMLGQPVHEMLVSEEKQGMGTHEDVEKQDKNEDKDESMEKPTSIPGADLRAPERYTRSHDDRSSAELGLTAVQIRDIVRQEVDVVRTDLRHDILNIHSELVTLSTRQSQEMVTVLKERDHIIARLEEEVKRLQADNTRLRRKYGIS